jgi:hypothetical protein
MVVFAVAENSLDLSVQGPHDADPRKHRGPAQPTTSSRLSIAARHSAVLCSAFGSLVM